MCGMLGSQRELACICGVSCQYYTCAMFHAVRARGGASSFLNTPLQTGLHLRRRLPDAALLACRYGQRIGTISIVADDKQQAKKVESQLKVNFAIVDVSSVHVWEGRGVADS